MIKCHEIDDYLYGRRDVLLVIWRLVIVFSHEQWQMNQPRQPARPFSWHHANGRRGSRGPSFSKRPWPDGAAAPPLTVYGWLRSRAALGSTLAKELHSVRRNHSRLDVSFIEHPFWCVLGVGITAEGLGYEPVRSLGASRRRLSPYEIYQ